MATTLFTLNAHSETVFSPSDEMAVHVKGQHCTVRCIKGYST
jgi:hypothetical protein